MADLLLFATSLDLPFQRRIVYGHQITGRRDIGYDKLEKEHYILYKFDSCCVNRIVWGSKVIRRLKLFNHLTMKRHVYRQDNKQLSELMSRIMNGML